MLSTMLNSDNNHVINKSNIIKLVIDINKITSLINRTLTDAWKKMIYSYARETYPEKQSESFDLSDLY
jgi:hypothetical protein